MLKQRDLLGLEYLDAEEIKLILDTAESFKEVGTRQVKKVPALRGVTVVNFFHEPSTRTRTSFELAAKRLSADVVSFTSGASSLKKGETLVDTAQNIEAMSIDMVVIRHSCAGAPAMLARALKASVINAGDGVHEHPTQGLLDMFTIREKKGKLKGLKVVFVGDITHSRVARSNIWGMRKMGVEVAVAGPATLIPPRIEEMGVKVYHNVEQALKDADVAYILRIQLERQQSGLFPSIREYASIYGINNRTLQRAKPGIMVMHPGPMNRGIEISSGVADGPSAVILDQVTNGVAVRMAVLYLLAQRRGKLEDETKEAGNKAKRTVVRKGRTK